MSSQAPPILQINHPTPNNQSPVETTIPEDVCFPTSPLARHQSETSPLILPPTPPLPVPLIRTLTVDDQPRQDANYYSPPTQRSPACMTRTTSHSDNISNVSSLGPAVSLHSAHSSEIGRTTCSGSSSEYLATPIFQGDNDNPPYKSRRGSAGSLKMMKKLRSVNTELHEAVAQKKSQSRHKKQGECKSHRQIKVREHQSRSYWWLPVRQVLPTAPRDQKDIFEGQHGQHTSGKLPSSSVTGHFSPNAISMPLPGSARRWSSVEIGAHQALSELAAALPPVSSAVLPSPTSEQFLSSSRGDVHHDIVRTVRERLTLRKIPSVQLKTPVSITLRRASFVGSLSGTSETPNSVQNSVEVSGGSTPLAKLQELLNQRDSSAKYLITSHDIDSITELIEENLKQKYERRPYTGANFSSSGGSRSPSVTSKGIVIPQNVPEFAITVAEAQESQVPFHDSLQFNPLGGGRTSHSPVSSVHSEHEVIWQDRSSSRSRSSTEESEPMRSPYCKGLRACDTLRDKSQNHECKSKPSSPAKDDKSEAFDPRNANASINEWSLRTSHSEIQLVVTSDSEPNITSKNLNNSAESARGARSTAQATTKGRSKFKARPVPRPALSESNLHKSRSRGLTLEDVVSFPPLPPRQTTDEWISPLPDMGNTTTPALNTSRSLHDIGLDANFGPQSSKTVTPQASQANLCQSDLSPPRTVSPAKSIEFKLGFDIRKKSILKKDPIVDPSPLESGEAVLGIGMRTKSFVKDHPTAVPRVGDLSRLGSSIGSHGHERRRSSAAPGSKIQRIRTIDNIHKGERDVPPGKWRPPSICPPRKSPSPTEIEKAKDSQQSSQANRTRGRGAGFFDREALIKDRSPSQPKVDTVGIYAQLTGTRGIQASQNPCLLEIGPCQPHDCDDCSKDPRTPSVDWIG